MCPLFSEHKDLFKKDSVVTDSCGIKTKICRQMAAHKDLHLLLIGAHPMAGREVSGYDNSLNNLFDTHLYLYPGGRTRARWMP